VYQTLDAAPDPSWLDDAIADGRAIANGAYQAVAIPVGDPPLGGISIYVSDTNDGCLRHYLVGPGLLADEAQTVARQWVDALASGEPPAAPGHVELDVGYFGRRYTDAPPNFAIDQFSADGSQVATLTDDEVELLFPRFTLADGSTVALEGDPNFGRCFNQSLTRVSGGSSGPLHSDLAEARSIGVTPTGVVIAGRDVCPAGTRWGDPGTRWELVALDPAAPASEPEILLTRESDPSQIQFNDGQIVFAMGEMHVEDISPDGRYVALRDLFNIEQSKWHVLDLETPGPVLAIESTCELAGDIVGPPRFVGDGIVVVARLCGEPHTANASPYESIGSGDVQVEAIDFTAALPSQRIVWHSSALGLGADGYSRTVDLSARRDDDDAVWALLSGGGGVELASRTFALHGDDAVEITRTGYLVFAFDPADLISPWDELPA
jgi:hypothetical protein